MNQLVWTFPLDLGKRCFHGFSELLLLAGPRKASRGREQLPCPWLTCPSRCCTRCSPASSCTCRRTSPTTQLQGRYSVHCQSTQASMALGNTRLSVSSACFHPHLGVSAGLVLERVAHRALLRRHLGAIERFNVYRGAGLPRTPAGTAEDGAPNPVHPSRSSVRPRAARPAPSQVVLSTGSRSIRRIQALAQPQKSHCGTRNWGRRGKIAATLSASVA